MVFFTSICKLMTGIIKYDIFSRSHFMISLRDCSSHELCLWQSTLGDSNSVYGVHWNSGQLNITRDSGVTESKDKWDTPVTVPERANRGSRKSSLLPTAGFRVSARPSNGGVQIRPTRHEKEETSTKQNETEIRPCDSSIDMQRYLIEKSFKLFPKRVNSDFYLHVTNVSMLLIICLFNNVHDK